MYYQKTRSHKKISAIGCLAVTPGGRKVRMFFRLHQDRILTRYEVKPKNLPAMVKLYQSCLKFRVFIEGKKPENSNKISIYRFGFENSGSYRGKKNANFKHDQYSFYYYTDEVL